MRRVLGLAVVTVLAVTGLTACMSGDGGERRSAALASVTATGGQPFQQAYARDGVNGESLGSNSFTVPAGKLLVIERITGRMILPTGQEPRDTYISTRAGGSLAYHRLMKLEPRQEAGYFTFSQDATFYADPGSTVTFYMTRSSPSSAWGYYMTLSGYLVDA